MCGIAGWLGSSFDSSQSDQERVLSELTKTLSHRGPDDSGAWLDLDRQIALGHQRLSVIDLSPAGHQPMISASGRYVLAFNGEIYNHTKLREDLLANHSERAPHWRGHSDTESLAAGFDVWGVRRTLERAVGMFAIAVWDRQEQTLTLARDRMGEKPLYFGWCGGSFVFASELKAVKQHPGFTSEIDRGALQSYFRYSYVPAPYSIYKGIYKLEPGCLLTVTLAGASNAANAAPVAGSEGTGWVLERYWSLQDKAAAGQDSPLHNERKVLETLEEALSESIKGQSIADVPLGAFLSGGIDSSLIVALMQRQAARPVKTFTIGFHEQEHSEAKHARAIASHLGTDHTEMMLSAQDALDVIPRLPRIYDEPFADSSQIPTFLVAQMAREHVTVALSGDAGDELFGGYNRYCWAPGIWDKLSRVPTGLRDRVLSSLAGGGPAAGLLSLLPGRFKVALAGEKALKLQRASRDAASLDDFYLGLVSEWLDADQLVKGGEELPTILSNPEAWPEFADPEHRMMYLDACTYLPDDILVKVDRAAMAVSLETRVPFLDHRVVELAWQLPLSMKISAGQGKWALRQILDKYVPQRLMERPKQGFAIPLADWLRGPLREWAESLIDPAKLEQQGYLRSSLVTKKWREHQSGSANWEHSLWSVLMFQAWLEEMESA